MYYVVAFIAFFLLFQAAIARLEKRLVWPYGPPESEPQFDDLTGFGDRWVSDAHDAGFSLLGWSADLKGPRYRVSYAMMTAPDGDCFVIIAVGHVFGIPLRGACIYTFATDGRVFYTTNEQAGVEFDLLRQWRGQLTRAKTFVKLLKRHQDLICDLVVNPCPLNSGRELDDFRSIREEHFTRMSRHGLITFVDDSGCRWHYTFRGALKLAAWSYTIGLLRAVTLGRVPRVA